MINGSASQTNTIGGEWTVRWDTAADTVSGDTIGFINDAQREE